MKIPLKKRNLWEEKLKFKYSSIVSSIKSSSKDTFNFCHSIYRDSVDSIKRVCGRNGVTHGNKCELNCAKKKSLYNQS